MSARRMSIMLALGALMSLALVANALANHERPWGATPDKDSLVTAYENCGTFGAPNRNHAIFGIPSCNPPKEKSDYLTSGTPDASSPDSGGVPSKLLARLKKTVTVGDPTTAADEADITVNLDITDVRCRTALVTATPAVCATANTAAGPDYSGEVNVVLNVNRITDHANGPGKTPGTTVAFVRTVPVACVDTVDPTIGSHCSAVTTLDALYPGSVLEGERGIWEFDRSIIQDGGSDGDVDTTGDGEDTFLEDGIFVP